MDSLIVLRRPLRKTQVEPKFIIPKKSKKVQLKLAPILPSHGCTQPPISFVKLYEEACVDVLWRQASREHLHLPSRAKLSAEWPLEAPEPRGRHSLKGPEPRGRRSPLGSLSSASLVTQYPGRRLHDPPPPPFRAARAELILELDYDTIFKDSAFASTTNSFF